MTGYGDTIQFWLGPITGLVALFGLATAIAHIRFFTGVDEPLARHLRYIFVTDALIYCGAVLASIWFFFQLRGPDAWIPVNLLKFMALAANIYASYRFYRHYRMIRDARRD